MMRKWLRVLIVVSVFYLPFIAGAATKKDPSPPPRALAIEMGAPFHDQAILQRGVKVPVWGWNEPGVAVTVVFAGQEKTSTAGKDGRWLVELDPLEASFKSREMTITDSTGKREVLKGLLVGEVWMCSGQSNMQFEAAETTVGWSLIPGIMARVEAGEEKMPVIREVKVTDKFSSLYPYDKAKAKWSSEWGGFSAVAFAFAYEIARETEVPVGIVNCSFSTTMIQAWIPREGFAGGGDKYTQDIYRKVLINDFTTPEHEAAWDAYKRQMIAWGKESKKRVEKGLKPKERPTVPGNMNGNRDATWMCNAKTIPMAPYAMRGAIWNQGYANIGEGLAYRNNLHSLVRGLRAIWDNPELPVYFHQFYASGGASDTFSLVDGASEMRLATWLAHRDISNAAMASQIDITGGVHYRSKTVPGQRLSLHALKNQYGKELVANGPMYKNYTVKGDKVILELYHAAGLFVGQNVPVKKSFPKVKTVENGEDQVDLFYLVGEDLVWHKAKMAIVGSTIELTARGVEAPRGVAYGRISIGGKPSVYNEALLPLTPFVFYDHRLVVSQQWDLDYIAIPGFENSPELFRWPMDHFEVFGEVKDPTSYGLREKHRKLWLLSPQFAHNCVIQADAPTRLYGKAIPKSVVTVKFAGFEKSVTMGEEQDEWELTVPAMKASAEPKVLHVTCTLAGGLAHERKITNVVVGDVWYVAANDLKVLSGPGVPKRGPAPVEAWEGDAPQLRMLNSFAQRLDEDMPSRFKLNSSGYQDSTLFARWSPTTGLTRELAERIHAKTDKPVGIVVFDPKKTSLKQWTGFAFLPKVSEWQADYEELYPHYHPDHNSLVKNSAEYLSLWQEYWKRVKTEPDFETGELVDFPGLSRAETKAARFYNQLVCAFSPGNFKAVLFLTSKNVLADTDGSDFGEQLSVMANSWKDAFTRGKQVIDPHFVCAIPSESLVGELAEPTGIKGLSCVLEFSEWPGISNKRVESHYESTVNEALSKLIDDAVTEVY